jgi:hypothetical protein
MKKRNIFLTIFSLLTVSIAVCFLAVNIDNFENKENVFSFQAVLAQEGGSINFGWQEPESGDNVSFYRLYHGVKSGNYNDIIPTTKANNSLVLDISNFETYNHYFTISAVDVYGNESELSSEIHINIDPEYKNETNPELLLCGNGLKEGDEICDGGYMFCEIAGNEYIGEKACDNDCINWGTCSPVEFCGDEIINGNEICEIGDKKGCVNTSGQIGEQLCDNCVGWNVCTTP